MDCISIKLFFKDKRKGEERKKGMVGGRKREKEWGRKGKKERFLSPMMVIAFPISEYLRSQNHHQNVPWWESCGRFRKILHRPNKLPLPCSPHCSSEQCHINVANVWPTGFSSLSLVVPSLVIHSQSKWWNMIELASVFFS